MYTSIGVMASAFFGGGCDGDGVMVNHDMMDMTNMMVAMRSR